MSKGDWMTDEQFEIDLFGIDEIVDAVCVCGHNKARAKRGGIWEGSTTDIRCCQCGRIVGERMTPGKVYSMAQCRFCGNHRKVGQPFDDWVKPTFTDWDKLLPGDMICNDCLFWFEEASAELAARIGKDKPQRMRNYSHFVVDGEWIPLSKSDKACMQELLLDHPFPELVAIAESGQKHIVFRATRNPPNSAAGWVQFEEHQLFVRPNELRALLNTIEALYVTFSKSEIETGSYKQYRIVQFGLAQWHELEEIIHLQRGSLLFHLAIFLAQKEEGNDDTDTRGCGQPAGHHLAGSAGRLQEPSPDEHLATIRGQHPVSGIHQQPGKVCQLTLFEAPGPDGP